MTKKAFDEVKQKRPVPSGAWKPGQSGNPKGRPKKNQALSAILAKSSKKNITLIDEATGQERTVTRNEMIAEILMTAITLGRIVFPLLNGETEKTPDFVLDTSEWIKLTDFYYKRVEGNPGTKSPDVDDEDKWDGN